MWVLRRSAVVRRLGRTLQSACPAISRSDFIGMGCRLGIGILVSLSGDTNRQQKFENCECISLAGWEVALLFRFPGEEAARLPALSGTRELELILGPPGGHPTARNLALVLRSLGVLREGALGGRTQVPVIAALLPYESCLGQQPSQRKRLSPLRTSTEQWPGGRVPGLRSTCCRVRLVPSEGGLRSSRGGGQGPTS